MNSPSHSAIFEWRPAAWLRVSGADAGAFLQGQFTNDLRTATSNIAVYGLWLNLKGKVLADSFVFRGSGSDEYWLGSYFSAATVIRERLESFVIADDVLVEDQTAQWAAVSVFGPEAGEWVARHQPAAAPRSFVFAGRRDQAAVTEWVFPLDHAPQVAAARRGAPTLTAEAVERRRIEAAIPAIPTDIGPGDLPNEAGLENSAISYTKGCYLGQEVMARLKSMGQVRRRLLRVRSSAAAPTRLPAPLYLGLRQVGEVRSAAATENGWIGLAMLSLLHVSAGAGLAFAPDAAAQVHIVDAP